VTTQRKKIRVHNQIRQVNSKPIEVSSTQGKKSECKTKLGKSIASQWKSMTTQRKNIRVHNQIGKSIVSQ